MPASEIVTIIVALLNALVGVVSVYLNRNHTVDTAASAAAASKSEYNAAVSLREALDAATRAGTFAATAAGHAEQSVNAQTGAARHADAAISAAIRAENAPAVTHADIADNGSADSTAGPAPEVSS